ncbi:MAG: Cof-type HAD-IIB family hydrolase [Rectinema sp.]
MKPRMLALDLDDTLLHRDLTISAVNVAALKEAEEAGIKIVLASGRNIVSMRGYADFLGMNRPGDFLICSNGAEMVAADSGEIVERLMLSRELCFEAAGAIEAAGFGWQVYVDGKILCNELNDWALKDGGLTGQPVIEAGDRDALFANGQVKFVIPGEPERISALLVELSSRFEGRAEVLTSKPYFLEVLPLGADKGAALSRLAASLGIPMASVMAIGDAMNDLGMIRASGWGCAPANAIPSVRAAARVVSDRTNDEDAVADLIRKIALA